MGHLGGLGLCWCASGSRLPWVVVGMGLQGGFGFWLEVKDERRFEDCILLRIFMGFQGNFQI